MCRFVTTAHRVTAPPATRNLVEPLEGRRLMSATISGDGVLAVEGTNKSDEIILSLDAADASTLVVKVNGEVSTFAVGDITAGGAIVRGYAGKDKLAVDETNGDLPLSVTLLGGHGKDHLVGGSGDDHLDGGTAKDKLFGNAGDDELIGGNGNDLLDGGDGDDYLVGNRGVDELRGGDGADDLDGGRGHDRIYGAAGNDDFVSWDRGSERKDDDADDDGSNLLEEVEDEAAAAEDRAEFA
jgi:Ca2+-binding RTX toxin-like protein